MSERCGYCKQKINRWLRSPRDRPYCPECGAISKSHQGGVES